MLVVAGIVGSHTVKHKAAGINIDLWAGIAMVIFAIIMIAWALLRPVVPSRRRPGARARGAYAARPLPDLKPGRTVHVHATVCAVSSLQPAGVEPAGHSEALLTVPSGARLGLGSAPFRLSHRLAGHPAFQREALARLLDAVPRPWTLHQDAKREVVTPVARFISDERPLGDIIRNLEQTSAWLVTRHLEHVSPYRDLLDRCVHQVAPLVPSREGRTLDRGAMMVIGSPHAVVPVHIDRHHNLLLQIEGRKEFCVGWFDDPREQAREIGRNFGRRPSASHRVPDRQVSFHLGPGDGIYIPAYAFHWVQGAPGSSVALSCAFRTELTERAELAQVLNAELRRLGIPSRSPVGSRSDRLKASVVRLHRRVGRRRGG